MPLCVPSPRQDEVGMAEKISDNSARLKLSEIASYVILSMCGLNAFSLLNFNEAKFSFLL